MASKSPAGAAAADVSAPVPYSLPKNLDTPRTFPPVADRAAWEARRERIRRQVLVSCGLYPLPPKTPLKARIFGRVERAGYTIEKVCFQTYPGFYLAGNLYRPRPTPKDESHPAARVPGILVTHGHWAVGRMADTDAGSIPARAITFARMGCVAFTYDMVGYNDTRQIPDHYGAQWAGDRAHWLWSVSLMGLQTWNSVRALDFLESLPDVDKSRMAITGESGGGTQTMMLGAIDDRLAAVGPCVMVSHSMQGGCLCENSPGLRIDYSNMEIAAAAGPRPQIMVGATGDWTKTMMTIEGPAVKSIYDLEGAGDRLKYVIFPFNHNINKTSRDAVYQFFGRVLLHDPAADSFTEPPYKMEPVEELRVFPDNTPMPADAKSADELTRYLKELGESRLEKAKPKDRSSLAAFKKQFRPLWETVLHLDLRGGGAATEMTPPARSADGVDDRSFVLPRADGGPDVYLRVLLPRARAGARAGAVSKMAVLLDGGGSDAFTDPATGAPGPRVMALLSRGIAVALPQLFLQPGRADAVVAAARRKMLDNFGQFFTTYNRTDLQERLQDIAVVCAYLRKAGHGSISMAGFGDAGVLAMLAAPLADAVAADCGRLDLTNDDTLLSDALFTPGLRRMGDFRTALSLAAPHPALLFNTGARFAGLDWVRDVYAGVGAADALKLEPETVNDSAVIGWLAAH
jgi:dienelactone hydrolase